MLEQDAMRDDPEFGRGSTGACLWRHVVQSAHTRTRGLTGKVQGKPKVAQAQLAIRCEE